MERESLVNIEGYTIPWFSNVYVTRRLRENILTWKKEENLSDSKIGIFVKIDGEWTKFGKKSGAVLT